ncbi:hypothetical protein EHW67_13955 [Arenibacter aquaticus]|uniref:Uncharacterized protein n=1 Tax=Arenibacter aquaticus TaxID=2489054 RepID=A0A430K114_9FLAO|nr:hypothetical protein EHW67_13955 [Arenibacter aquaticus]
MVKRKLCERRNIFEIAKRNAIHICNSHQPTHKPKIAKEYVFANADKNELNEKKPAYNIVSYEKHLSSSLNLIFYSLTISLSPETTYPIT